MTSTEQQVGEVLKLHEMVYADDGFNRYGWNPQCTTAITSLIEQREREAQKKEQERCKVILKLVIGLETLKEKSDE